MNYARSKIYRIYSDLDELEGQEYIGSTAEPTLARRMGKHRADAKSGKTSRLWSTMRQLGIENFYIELVEQYPCNSKDELRQRENQVIRERQPVWNQRGAYQTAEEKREYNSNYQKTNRARYNQLSKKHQKKIKDLKKIFCVECELPVSAKSRLARHRRGPRHIRCFCEYHGIELEDYDPDLPVEYGNDLLNELGIDQPEWESD